jgi:hypothetical protein
MKNKCKHGSIACAYTKGCQKDNLIFTTRIIWKKATYAHFLCPIIWKQKTKYGLSQEYSYCSFFSLYGPRLKRDNIRRELKSDKTKIVD